MRVIAGCIAALCLIASPAMAGANGAGDSAATTSSAQPSSASTASASTSAKPETVTSDSELQQLKDLIEQQSKMLEQQGQELKDQQAEMQQLKQQITGGATSNGGALTAAPVVGTAAIGPVVGVANANAAIATVAATPAQAGTAADQPASIKFKGITLTPSGFFAGEAVWRQKAMASDVNTPFNSVPFSGASQAHMDEFNGSGRQSRIAMLAQGKLNNVTFSGYYEFDFLSAGTTSNNNQSNSYTARQRQFWGQAAFANGFTFTGGQQWSLLTETATGMNNRTENLPMVIDAQYNVGFSWARQFGLRVTKSFADNKFWLGASVEQGQATVTVHGNPTVNAGGSVVCTSANCGTTTTINPTVQNNFLLGAFGTSGGLYNPLGNYQYNPSPDVIVKAVAEPGFGHYEVFGLFSEFRDRVFPCVLAPIGGTIPAGCSSAALPGSTSNPASSAFGAHNDTRAGGGVGANARWSLLSKKVDFGLHFLGGSGVGRYGSAGLADATTRPDGTLALLHNYQALGTLQLHPTPKMDVYFNVGLEYEARAGYVKSGTTQNMGYGYASINNSGCWAETEPVTGPSTGSNTGVPTGVGGSTGFIPGPLANCTGDTRNIVEGTVGFWYRFYNGPAGRFQWGMQYSDYVKNTWRGVGATPTQYANGIGQSGQPTANQNMVFTSFRYYLP
jgi:hypothetical protein